MTIAETKKNPSLRCVSGTTAIPNPLEQWESEGGSVSQPPHDTHQVHQQHPAPAVLDARTLVEDFDAHTVASREANTGVASRDIRPRIRERLARRAETLLEAASRETVTSQSTPDLFDADDPDCPTPRIVQGLAVEPSAKERLSHVFAQRYRLEKVLGSGGMGVVYLARDLELDLDVALKLLRRDVTNIPSAVARFRKEVRLARRVTHENVSRTFDIAFHGPDLFITMEAVAGRTLSSFTAEARLKPEQVAEVAVQMCAGLSAAHRAGVVHRDLKPQNIMLDGGNSGRIGRVVLMDFGVAQTTDLNPEEVTSPGQLIGTPSYMSPEQLECLHVDTRTDLFSFGVILFELLTGHLPWAGRSVMAAARYRLRLHAPDLGEAQQTVPEEIAALTTGCLAELPDDRPGSAELVGSILQRWADSFGRRGRQSVAIR